MLLLLITITTIKPLFCLSVCFGGENIFYLLISDFVPSTVNFWRNVGVVLLEYITALAPGDLEASTRILKKLMELLNQ